MNSAEYRETSSQGSSYQLLLQSRVNPATIKVAPADWHHDGEYWIIPDGSYIRPYGVCMFEVSSWNNQFPIWERQGIFDDSSDQLPYDDEGPSQPVQGNPQQSTLFTSSDATPTPPPTTPPATSE